MASGLDLAGVVGTWVAVALALIALVGIVAPVLLIRESRSDRFQALNAVDDQNTGYITGGLKLRGSSTYFQKVKVPLLSSPPGPNVIFDRASIANLAQATGWVNFAAAIERYTSSTDKGDGLLLFHKQTWLPVHRFWLLTFGLFGRYGHREDRGIAISQSNAQRLMIERKPAYHGHNIPARRSLQPYYGLTGKILWAPMSPEATMADGMIDRLYFKAHSAESRRDPFPEAIPLKTLFWLSLGCLPLDHLPPDNPDTTRVYDLATYRDALISRQQAREDVHEVLFFRFQEREGWTDWGAQSQWAFAMGVNKYSLWRLEKDEVPDSPEAIVEEAKVDKGHWHIIPDTGERHLVWRSDLHSLVQELMTMPISRHGFLFDQRRDMLMSILKPSIELFYEKLLPSLESQNSPERLSPSVTHGSGENAIGARIEEQVPLATEARQAATVLRLVKRYEVFGRRKTEAHAVLDAELSKRGMGASEHIRAVVAILMATTEAFRAEVARGIRDTAEVSNTCLKLRPVEKQAILIRAPAPAPGVQQPDQHNNGDRANVLDHDRDSNVRATVATETDATEATPASQGLPNEVLPRDGPSQEKPVGSPQVEVGKPSITRHATNNHEQEDTVHTDSPASGDLVQTFSLDSAALVPHGGTRRTAQETYRFDDYWPGIYAAALQACNRFAYFNAQLTSSHLISLIQQLGDVAHVSARPELPSRDEARAEGAVVPLPPVPLPTTVYNDTELSGTQDSLILSSTGGEERSVVMHQGIAFGLSGRNTASCLGDSIAGGPARSHRSTRSAPPAIHQ
ncbi:uncharacterized protein F5Z01DRAFT_491329 [Emericellopsis atlantica]|uniref:Uncharacterized protein n=1 Tax=Emericellopsis atlantica TaxID=2614577 RepID=A0A9P7ZSI6_9HYPO|nr:uncharacterized protein F5Z01DRAFT_491329 [Emericellopsis atlantica]KAG9256863.1 hypothetical protein F5Z01DRAFT_491329 [Emericellopsis atlantica]